jgi:O-succinylbenzoic acid--CoA ligase
MIGTMLPDWLAQRAAISPDRLALIADGTHWSFGALDRWAQSLAAALAERGVQAGDRIGLLLRNSPEFIAVVHGAPRVGGVLVPLNTRLVAGELAGQLADVGARLVLYDATHAATAQTLQGLVPSLQVLDVRDLTAGSENGDRQTPGAARSIDLATLHTIIYTSGTTGRPKGAMLTFGNHWWSAIGSVLNLGLRDDDSWLAVLPLFHVGGLAILIRNVVYGIPVVLHETFDPVAVNAAIDQQGISCVSLVSVMLRRVLDARGEAPMPASLRCVLLGGGPVPKPLLERCVRSHLPVIQTYGLTETASQAVTLAPADALRKVGSAGKPLLPNELRIERDNAPAPPGTAGEILVRGPSVTVGYVNQPAETRRALRDGWLRTGDVGYLDADGYLYVLDRRDDLIISGGENVYPAEVEAALLDHPAIEDAAVVGLPDAEWGEAPVAAVKRRTGKALDADEVLRFCTTRLARYKVPRTIHVVEALPRNAAGKLLRRLVRERLLAGVPTQVGADRREDE